MNKTEQLPGANNEAISLGDFFANIGRNIKYLFGKWLIIITVAVVFGLLGLAVSLFKKIVYTAKCTFVLEDGSKMGSLGQYAGLAAIAGIDINSGGSGLFQGDNILELYKSRLMIEKTLLSNVVIDGRKQLLIDRYISSYDLLAKWKRKDRLNSINFKGDPQYFNRHQDSLITDFADIFNKKVLTVNKLDKKLNIIVVTVSTNDELFSKEFTIKLVENVNAFYVQTKIKKSAQNVAVLQHLADSVRRALNLSIGGVASAVDAAPNANPQLLSLRVPSQKRQVDVQAESAVYGEVVKNLEVSKMSLLQDKPLIQIIDTAVLPLDNDHISKLKGIVMGMILGGFIAVFGLIAGRLMFRLKLN